MGNYKKLFSRKSLFPVIRRNYFFWESMKRLADLVIGSFKHTQNIDFFFRESIKKFGGPSYVFFVTDSKNCILSGKYKEVLKASFGGNLVYWMCQIRALYTTLGNLLFYSHLCKK